MVKNLIILFLFSVVNSDPVRQKLCPNSEASLNPVVEVLIFPCGRPGNATDEATTNYVDKLFQHTNNVTLEKFDLKFGYEMEFLSKEIVDDIDPNFCMHSCDIDKMNDLLALYFLGTKSELFFFRLALLHCDDYFNTKTEDTGIPETKINRSTIKKKSDKPSLKLEDLLEKIHKTIKDSVNSIKLDNNLISGPEKETKTNDDIVDKTASKIKDEVSKQLDPLSIETKEAQKNLWNLEPILKTEKMTVVSSTESCERFSVVTMFEMDNVETASFWLQTVIYSYFGLGKKEIKEMQTVLLRKKISPSLSFKMVQTICDSIVLKRNDAYNSNCLYKQQLNIYDFSPFAVSCGIVLVIILAIYIYNKRLRDREVYRLQLIGGREY